jgi:malonate-semialdehyde dehydrogenase (acetylating)/methylmalonate-semialdehyde dehydrogenase
MSTTIDTPTTARTAIPHVIGARVGRRTHGPSSTPRRASRPARSPWHPPTSSTRRRARARAQRGWRETGLGKRQQVMFRLREIVASRAEELARIITAEHGKTVPDALGEVAGLENVEFCTSLMHHLKGEYSEQVASGVDVHQVRQPIGSSRASRRSTSPRWCRCGW